MRNQLYHHGIGITATTRDAHRYAQLAVALLNTFGRVDLTPRLREMEAHHALRLPIRDLEKALDRFREKVKFIVGEMESRLLKPSFVRDLRELGEQFWKEPEDWAELFADIAASHGLPEKHLEHVLDHFYDWQKKGTPGTYMPPDLEDEYTIYLSFMDSVLCLNDAGLWEDMENVLDMYWIAKKHLKDATSFTVPPTEEYLERARQLVNQLDAARDLLPNWLSKADEAQEEE